MSDMADVIWSHLEHNGDEYDLAYSRSIRKLADDLQTLLSAAGFGLVADTKAEALEEAADGFARAGNNVRNSTYVESGIYHDLVQQARGLESAAETLRAQAAKIRAVS